MQNVNVLDASANADSTCVRKVVCSCLILRTSRSQAFHRVELLFQHRARPALALPIGTAQ